MIKLFYISERVKVALIVLIACVFVNAPFIYGYLATPEDMVFTGVSHLNSIDTYTYLSWIKQASEGKILLEGLFTGEQQNIGLLHPLFLVIGWINWVLGVPTILMYFIAKTLAIIVLLLTIYKFIGQWEQYINKKLFLFILVIFSSGVGWMVSPISTDLWVTESVTFLNLYNSLLNTFSLSLILSVFIISINNFNKKQIWPLLMAGILTNFLVLIHSYDLGIVLPVLFIYALYEWRYKKNKIFVYKVFLLAFLTLPAVLWQYWVMQNNYVFMVWGTLQTSVPSPKPAFYLAGYGLLALFAFIEIVFGLAEKKTKYHFLIYWILVVAVLLYTPWLLDFQRKFSQGLHIPIAILAGFGILRFLSEIRSSKLKYLIITSLIVFLPASNLSVMKTDIISFKTHSYPYYISKYEVEAIKWIDRNKQANTLVLAQPELANYIPGIAGAKVFTGVGDQTVDFTNKISMANLVLNGNITDMNTLEKIIKNKNITHMVVDKTSYLFINIDNSPADFLNLVYENPDIQIYQTR